MKITFKQFVKDYKEYYQENNVRIADEDDMAVVIEELYEKDNFDIDYENKVITIWNNGEYIDNEESEVEEVKTVTSKFEKGQKVLAMDGSERKEGIVDGFTSKGDIWVKFLGSGLSTYRCLNRPNEVEAYNEGEKKENFKKDIKVNDDVVVFTNVVRRNKQVATHFKGIVISVDGDNITIKIKNKLGLQVFNSKQVAKIN